MSDPKTADSSTKTSKEDKKQLDAELNEALEESFPGSDPVSMTQPATVEAGRRQQAKRLVRPPRAPSPVRGSIYYRSNSTACLALRVPDR